MTRQHVLRLVLAGLALLLVGAVLGAIGAIATPARLEIAGSNAAIRLHVGRDYDELNLSGVLTGKRASGRNLLGEPVGVGISLDLDPETFVTQGGEFNSDVLPAYIQAYSDPEQLAKDLQWAVTKHVLVWMISGAGIALVLGGLGLAYRSQRRRRDAALDGTQRRLVHAYWAPERSFVRHAVLGVVVLVVLASVPGTVGEPDRPTPISGNALLANTPLAGTQVGGLLEPALSAAADYIRTYYADTITYYDQLRTKLEHLLDGDPLTLPSGPDVTNLVFVTDRHCNIGIDRVVVALAQHYGITLLVSGGDDAFSGSFSFESACTANLASASQEAGMTDIFVGGNHDSPLTLGDEQEQKIHVLDNDVYETDGLRFAGIPDPRSSRYGKGIQPASAAVRGELIDQQGKAAGALACSAEGPVIEVLHDPTAGTLALQHGCGKAVLALDGHLHTQSGPTPVALPAGRAGYQFTGASSGGAPTEEEVESTFASRLTVGPLNHDATFEIVSVDRTTARLLAVSECRITPSQDITFAQQQVAG